MPLLAALALALVLLPALPASASVSATLNDPTTGFPIALTVLTVVAVVFALVWRARSRKKQDH